MYSKMKVNILIGTASIVLALAMIGVSYAQNGTTPTQPVTVGASAEVLIGTVTAIILAVLSIIKTLADKGILDKKAGTNAVMAADAAVAVYDTRLIVSELADAVVDTVKVSNPELAGEIDSKISNIMNKISTRVAEYQPKVDKFAQIANKLGNKGETTTDGIKEDEQLKDDIPDAIVPT